MSNLRYLQFQVLGSVNHTSTEENFVFIVFIIVKTCGEIFSICPNFLFGTRLNKTFDAC